MLGSAVLAGHEEGQRQEHECQEALEVEGERCVLAVVLHCNIQLLCFFVGVTRTIASSAT